MTARGWSVAVLRVLLGLAVAALGLGFVLFRQSPSDDRALGVVGETDVVANPSEMIELVGPIEILGPSGDVLSSETGALMNPATGDIQTLGASRLTNVR